MRETHAILQHFLHTLIIALAGCFCVQGNYRGRAGSPWGVAYCVPKQWLHARCEG